MKKKKFQSVLKQLIRNNGDCGGFGKMGFGCIVCPFNPGRLSNIIETCTASKNHEERLKIVQDMLKGIKEQEAKLKWLTELK